MVEQDMECPVCITRCANVVVQGDQLQVTCLRCGHYSISGTAETMLRQRFTARQVSNASGWIREHPGISITSRDIEPLGNVPTPTVMERAEKLLREVERRSPRLGAEIEFELRTPSSFELLGASWFLDLQEVNYLIAAVLAQRGLITHTYFGMEGLESHKVSVTPSGYAHLEELRRAKPDSQIGFCAMWFDARLQPVWHEAIEPAILGAGYEPKRVDWHEHTNKIDDEIIAPIRRSRFVVADCSGNRGGVYFEAGFAKGLGGGFLDVSRRAS